MNLDKLKAKKYGIKNDLEGILGTFRVSESEIYFVHRKDIQFIEELLKQIDSHYEEEVRKVNTGIIREEEVVPYNISSGDRKIIDRIVEHAQQYKEFGKVKYRIQDQYMAPSEVENEIKEYYPSKFLNKNDVDFLNSILSNLNKHYNLSAKQIIHVERIFDTVDERKEKEKAGVICFDPTNDPKIYDMGKRLINCAIGRRMVSNAVSGEDVIEAKEKYFLKGEAGLDELRESIKIELKNSKTKTRTLSDYEPVIKLLEKYMATINLNKYVIDGLKSATPRI